MHEGRYMDWGGYKMRAVVWVRKGPCERVHKRFNESQERSARSVQEVLHK